MYNDAIRQLIEFIQTSAPVVWDSLIRQVYVEAFGSALVMVVLIIAGIALLRLSLKLKREEDAREYSDDADDWWWGALALGILFLLLASVSLYMGIARLVNPIYYAIQLILPVVQ